MGTTGFNPRDSGAAGEPRACRLELAPGTEHASRAGLVRAAGTMLWDAVPKSFISTVKCSCRNASHHRIPLGRNSHPYGACPGCCPPCARAELLLNRLLVGSR